MKVSGTAEIRTGSISARSGSFSTERSSISPRPIALTGERTEGDDPLTAFAADVAPLGGMADRLSRAITAYAKVRTEATDSALSNRLFLTFGLLNDRLAAMLNADIVSATNLPAPMRERFLTDDGTYRVEVLREESRLVVGGRAVHGSLLRPLVGEDVAANLRSAGREGGALRRNGHGAQ